MKDSMALALLLLALSITIVAAFVSLQRIFIPASNFTAMAAGPGIGVYWDQTAANSCQSVYWGELYPGSRKTLAVYVKNERNDSMFYWLTTAQWSPIDASNYIHMSWDYDGSRANPGSVLKVSLIISVSPRTTGVNNFGFDIVVTGSPFARGDVNQDGRVDIKDVATTALAFGSYPADPNWNAVVDVNGDGHVDIRDISIVAHDYGKT